MSDLAKEIEVYLDVADCSEAYRLLERALTRLRELESEVSISEYWANELIDYFSGDDSFAIQVREHLQEALLRQEKTE